MESNKLDLGSKGLDLRSHRLDLWSERPNLGSERDMGACLRLGGGTYTGNQRKSPCVDSYRSSVPPRPLPKKDNHTFEQEG